jgi:hypothetical protein
MHKEQTDRQTFFFIYIDINFIVEILRKKVGCVDESCVYDLCW